MVNIAAEGKLRRHFSLLARQMGTEKGQYVILKPVGHRTGVRARINFKTIGDAVGIENVVQFCRIDA